MRDESTASLPPKQASRQRPTVYLWEALPPLLTVAGLLAWYGYLTNRPDPGVLLCSVAGGLGAQLRLISYQPTEPVRLPLPELLLFVLLSPLLGGLLGLAIYYLTASIVVTDKSFLNVRGLSIFVVFLTYVLNSIRSNALATPRSLTANVSPTVEDFHKLAEEIDTSLSSLLRTSGRVAPTLVAYSGYLNIRVMTGLEISVLVHLAPDPVRGSQSHLISVSGAEDMHVDFEVSLVPTEAEPLRFSPDRAMLSFNKAEASPEALFTAAPSEEATPAVWLRLIQYGRTVQVVSVSLAPALPEPPGQL